MKKVTAGKQRSLRPGVACYNMRLNYWITVARLLDPSEELVALQQLSLDARQDHHRNAQLSLLDTG